MRSPAGRVTAAYTVHCAACPATYTAPAGAGRTVAERHWLGGSWVYFGGEGGWLCPECGPAKMNRQHQRMYGEG